MFSPAEAYIDDCHADGRDGIDYSHDAGSNSREDVLDAGEYGAHVDGIAAGCSELFEKLTAAC